MAKLIPSPAIGSMSGSAGGITFSHGTAGAMFGAKNNHLSGQSPKQLAKRATFTTLSRRWSATLTDAQRAAWVAFAAAHQIHDALGNLVTLTGIQTYIRLNGALTSVAQAIIDDPPPTFSAGSPGAITVTAQQFGPPTLSVAVTTNPGANDTPAVWSMRLVKAGRKWTKGALKLIAVFPPGQAGPYDILSPWEEIYGLLLTNGFIIAQVQYTDSTSGAQGTRSVSSQVVL